MLILLALACTKTPADDSSAVTDDSAPATGPTVALLATPGDVRDAAPTPDGGTILFVDGAALGELKDGAVRQTFNLAGANGVVTDGEVAYVADGQQVYSVDLSDGTIAGVPGTETTNALSVELDGALLVGGSSAGAGAVFSVEGGTPTMLAGNLAGPISGVVRGPDGTVYAAGGSTVYRIAGTSATTLASGVNLGEPAGIALTPDNAALMVSSLSDAGTSQVLLITLSDGSTAIFDDVISANTASGGLHRAAELPTSYAWAGRTGGIYGVDF